MNRLILILLPAAFAGCASPTPNYDMRFGEAVRQARAAQTLNPGRPSTDPVMGLDGKSAQAAVQRYQDSFKAPPPVTPVIQIGGSIARPTR
jgi:hypothetical protein